MAEPLQHLSSKTGYPFTSLPASSLELQEGAERLSLSTSVYSAQASRWELEDQVQQRTRELQLEVLERTRAEKNLQQQFARISLLNRITGAIAERQEFDHILRAVLRELGRNLAIDFGAVMLLNEESGHLAIAATLTAPQTFERQSSLRERDSFSVAESGLLDCLRGRIFYAKDSAKVSNPLFGALLTAGFNSAVALPLTVAGAPFGVLLAARRPDDAFTSGECEFLRMLCDHVALAAHQARLYEQLRASYEELKQTQQAVMQQERLRALGEMASGIAHDINNALSPIVVYSELILLTDTGLSDSSRRNLAIIKTAGDDIAHFVSRMRDFYRKREESDSFSPLSCNELVQQVIDLTRPRWHDIPLAHGVVINLSQDLQPGIPVIEGNPAELREALTNLILNAVDAMPSGGNLTLATRMQPSAILGATPRVIIEVLDSGSGMDEVTRARCLEPFFSTKGKRGTGLGLSMVYGIMERHHGKIEIDSAIGQGTTMRLILPAPVDSSRDENTDDQPEIPRPLKILCIDDEPLLRDLLKETLQLDGHSVSLAEHGKAGVEAFQDAMDAAQPFDIVITDLGMPYMDGRQVADCLKKRSPSTPIILLTGWGAIMKAEGDQPGNVDALICKPPHLNHLRATLSRLAGPGKART